MEGALSLLQRYEGKARLIAGGTDLLGVLKGEILPEYPEALVNLKAIPGFDRISEDDEGLKIGAAASLAHIGRSESVRDRYPGLAQAAQAVATPEIRRMATIAGNLCQDNRCWYYRYPHQMGGRVLCLRKGRGPCHAVKGDNRYHAILGAEGCFAVCPSDLAVALSALDASIRIAHPGGERVVPVADFYGSMGPKLKTGEIVTEIRIPPAPDRATQAFQKFRLRASVDFAVVSAAMLITWDDGICQDARIILGAVAPMPYRARAAEDVIRGRSPQALAEAAAEAALDQARPLGMNAYKIEIARTLIKRLLIEIRPPSHI